MSRDWTATFAERLSETGVAPVHSEPLSGGREKGAKGPLPYVRVPESQIEKGCRRNPVYGEWERGSLLGTWRIKEDEEYLVIPRTFC